MEPAPLAKLVGDRVRHLRGQLGWSAQRLADACAEVGAPWLTRGMIAKIESGVRQSVTPEELAILAKALGSPLAELMPEEAEVHEQHGKLSVTPATSTSVTYGQYELGRMLKEARYKAALTQQAAALNLGCSQAKIAKIEAGRTKVSPDDLTTLLDLYSPPPDLIQHIQDAASEQWKAAGLSPQSLAQSDLEHRAIEIRVWHSERIPLPLQHEHYSLNRLKPTDDLTFLFKYWKMRTQVFTMEDPPAYRVILSESSLYRLPGGYTPDLAVDQMEHLLRLIDQHERLSIQVLPFSAPIVYVPGDFTLVHLPEDQQDVVYPEPTNDDTFPIKSAKQVRLFKDHWHKLIMAALSLEDSEKFIRAKRDEALEKLAQPSNPPD